MFLTETARRFPSLTPRFFAGKRSPPASKNLERVSQSFDENLLRRLKTLNPPSINLSWISLAVDFLCYIHTEAENLVSDLKLSGSENSLASYLDESVKLLDLCNSIVMEIERLRQGRLLIVSGIQRFQRCQNQNLAPEELCRVRDSLSDWGNRSFVHTNRRLQSPGELIRDLARGLGSSPSGKIKTVGDVVKRMIYTVGAMTVLVAGVMVSALTESTETIQVRVPAEFSWSDAFNGLASAVSVEIERRFKDASDRRRFVDDVDDVEKRVRSVCDVINNVVGGGVGEGKERLESGFKELEEMTVTLTERLDRFSDGVNGFFRTVLSTRNSLLGKFRVGSEMRLEQKGKM
ncbi:UPF0496 protein 4-like [Macadamia integrifolia]|uniref:UPF0496 protein 4-like n=1 Tax=Macadamia integrifolia TaxID=60698 RepID=UPI001C4E8ECE|nr:UPF0496 protein 4-like [Macadamia integrifolia]